MVKTGTVPALDEFGVTNKTVEFYDPGPKIWTIVQYPNSNYTGGTGHETTCAGPHPI